MAIHKKPNGKYLADLLDEHGIRIQRTFNKKAEATVFESSINSKKYQRKMIGLNLAKARYAIDRALSDFKNTKSDLRPSSQKKYAGVINEIKKFMDELGIQYMDEFTPDHSTLFFNAITAERKINNSYEDRIVKAKPKTINFYIQTFKAFFNDELLKNHIDKNPTIHVKNVKVEKKKPEYFTEEDLKAFFSQEMDVAHRHTFLGFLYTGARFAELANLIWEDVDFDKRVIYIRSTENHRTKTERSERTIPMTEKLFILLKDINQNPISKIYPFCTPQGKQLKERRLLDVCKRIASKAGIKSNAYIHKFRHTMATHLILNGVSIENIKELLGHWSIAETEIYAHNKPDHLHGEVKVLDKINI